MAQDSPPQHTTPEEDGPRTAGPADAEPAETEPADAKPADAKPADGPAVGGPAAEGRAAEGRAAAGRAAGGVGGPARLAGDPRRWLAVLAVAYVFMHHIGTTMAWLDGPDGDEGTRWADWIDLLTPYAVLLPAAAALLAGRAGRAAWTLYLVGAITYVEGHGIHLSANSVGNVDPGDVAHLWDEVVGHYFWYVGVALVFAALGVALARRDPPRGPVPYILAVLVGTTTMTNALEGGTALLDLAIAAGFAWWGWTTRRGLGRLLLVAFAPAVVMLIGYGIWHGGWPQPSDLGWI